METEIVVKSNKIRAVVVRSALRVAFSFFSSPGGARLRFHCCVCCANTLTAAAIMEVLVPTIGEEVAAAECESIEFVDATNIEVI